MKKIAILLLIVLILTSCTPRTEDAPVITDGTVDITSQLQNNIELQRNTFVGTVKSVTTENVLITKYNLDITEYTTYTVEVTESIDGLTPLGEIKVYCVGTNEQFPTRDSLNKGETYIVDAEPWIYGDEIVYLLSVYTVAFPRIDTADMVTLTQSDGTAVSLGSREEVIKKYYGAKSEYERLHPDFYTPTATASRLVEIFTAIEAKNSDTDIYNNERYTWRPDDEFIQLTADTSKAAVTEITELHQNPALTNEMLKEFFK